MKHKLNRWTKSELAVLENYDDATIDELMKLLPHRSKAAINMQKHMTKLRAALKKDKLQQKGKR